MKERLRSAFRADLLRRVLPLILLVAILPVLILGALNWLNTNGLKWDGLILNPGEVARGEAPPRTILGFRSEGIKDLAMTESYDALADQSLKALELRSVDLANRVADFMAERETDVHLLATVDPTAENYINFSRSKRGVLWTPEGMTEIPIYKEIAFIDTEGQEVLRIIDERPMPDVALRDVSQPANTTYKRETYFADTIDLAPDEVYVQPLMGWYLPRSVAYAAAENPDGQRYQGVMRFSTPVYEDGQLKGIVVLSLDWTHMMELVDHVVGSEEGYVVEVPAAEGSSPDNPQLAEIHSYLVGQDGWTLSHARDYHIVGLDENGQYVPALNAADAAEQSQSGYLPGHADEMVFLGTDEHPHPWPIIAEQNRAGISSGHVPVYLSRKDVPKAMAWASIPYYTRPYDTPAGLGWVGISIDAEEFSEAPNALGSEINRRATILATRIYAFMGFLTVVAVLAISFVIYRMVSRPVGEMLSVAQRVAEGDLTPIETDTQRRDELAQLQLALAQMVEQLRVIIARIRGAALHISTAADEVKATLNEQAGAASQSASAVTETTTTIEELAIISAQIADRSSSVVGTASATQQNAQDGAQAVSDTVAKLDEIRAANESNVREIITLGQRSQRISEVMALIDTIASRTKLIAFNAALEAAAAGDSGRRFGVVAMEVRRLADNVVESTEEIRERIDEIQAATNALVIASEQEAKRIAEGVTRGQAASQKLGQILTSAQSATIAAEQISLSTQQQRTAAEQVVDAVRSIQTDSQSVARGSEEATHVIADLVQLADELQRAVEQFKVGADDRLLDSASQSAVENDRDGSGVLAHDIA